MLTLTIPTRLGAGCAACCAVLSLAACSRDSDASVSTSSVPTSSAASAVTTAAPTTEASVPSTTIEINPPTVAGSNTSTLGAGAELPAVADQKDAIVYDHPQLGPMTITIAYPDRTETTLIDPTIRATLNASSDTVFEWTDFGLYYGFDFAGTSDRNPTISNPVDKRGHVLFEYELERGPGVVYLVPTADGFISGPDPADVQHTNATIVDSDGDGNYEIEQSFQVCTSSCADGYYYTHIWTWDGTRYSGPTEDPNLGPEENTRVNSAEQVFNDYIETAAAGDYDKAWAMMTPSGQAAYGQFDQFTDFWGDVDAADVDNIRGYKIMEPTNPAATTGIQAEVSYQLSDGTGLSETVSVIMTDTEPPKIDAYNAYGSAAR